MSLGGNGLMMMAGRTALTRISVYSEPWCMCCSSVDCISSSYQSFDWLAAFQLDLLQAILFIAV
jgi:hypothetical protein